MAFLRKGMSHHVHSRDEMQAFAAAVTQELVAGDVLFLEGELGSGKTTFVQGVARALGIEDPITSPTFTIMADYPVRQHPTIKTLVHLDIWRLSEEDVQGERAIQEAFESPQRQEAVTLIEWADRLSGATLPSHRLQFSHGDAPHERVVTYLSD